MPTETTAPDPAQIEDDRAIDAFAIAMSIKMDKCRAKGRGGWQTCSNDDLWAMLREHVEKGDPVDVGNLAMMLFNRAEGSTALRDVFADLADERYGQWLPIETAPRDGTKLDIWVVPPSEREPGDYPIFAAASGCRIPDARPCYTVAWQSSEGRTVTGRRYYEEDGDECLDPDDTSVRAARATHWMPQPEPPNER